MFRDLTATSTNLHILVILEKLRAFISELDREWNRPDRTDDDYDSFLTRVEKLVEMSNTCEQLHGNCGFEELTSGLQKLHRQISSRIIVKVR